VVASRDLRDMSERGLLVPIGEKRGRHYLAGEPLREIARRCRDTARSPNPYDLIAKKESAGQLSLRL
jgi:hypothetical protein